MLPQLSTNLAHLRPQMTHTNTQTTTHNPPQGTRANGRPHKRDPAPLLQIRTFAKQMRRILGDLNNFGEETHRQMRIPISPGCLGTTGWGEMAGNAWALQGGRANFSAHRPRYGRPGKPFRQCGARRPTHSQRYPKFVSERACCSASNQLLALRGFPQGDPEGDSSASWLPSLANDMGQKNTLRSDTQRCRTLGAGRPPLAFGPKAPSPKRPPVAKCVLGLSPFI